MQNIVILAGNVGATPEVRTTQGGTKITHFSLATSRPKRDSDKFVHHFKKSAVAKQVSRRVRNAEVRIEVLRSVARCSSPDQQAEGSLSSTGAWNDRLSAG